MKNNQIVQGRFNEEDEGKYINIVGNGEDNDNRKNIHTLDWNGNAGIMVNYHKKEYQ